MRERSCSTGGRAGSARQDQAAGLRRLFAAPEPHWLPVLLASERELDDARWLAAFAAACVDQGARTMVVDAARAQVASAFGLRMRYDLAHAFDGDCAPLEAVAAADDHLRILPAARALERIGRSPERLRRFEAGVRALAAGADCVLLVLPAPHGRALAGFGGAAGYSDAVVVAGAGAESERRVIGAMRSVAGVVEIDTFRLLFQGTGPDGPSRLYSRLAATGARELGARTSDAGSVHDASAIRRLVRLVRCRSTPGGDLCRAGPRGAHVETVS
jgi:hypothetical protein